MGIKVGDRVLFGADRGNENDPYLDRGVLVISVTESGHWPIRLLFDDGEYGLTDETEVYVLVPANQEEE